MIEKEFFGYVINCDKCSNYYNCECSDDFLEAVDMAKKQGWKIRKDKNDDWEHICPVCYQKELNN